MSRFGKIRLALWLYVCFDLFIGGYCGGFLDMTTCAAAQFTQVSGTVADPNGLPYAYGTIVPTLSSSATPTLGGLAYTPPTQPVGLDASGKFVMNLADNTQLLPANTQWGFKVCSAIGTVQPSPGKGSVCFTLAPITISGVSQDITAQLFAVAQPLQVATQINTFPAVGLPYGQTVSLNDPTVGAGVFFCNNKNGCINSLELTKIGDGFVGGTSGGGTISPTGNLATVGRGIWRQQNLLGFSNVNNTVNINTHKELSAPTFSNITADPGTHFQPIQSIVLFPNVISANDVIRIESDIICTTCSANSAQIQFRIADPSTSCTLSTVATSIGGNNQIWHAVFDIGPNGTPNGGTQNIDIQIESANAGATLLAPQKSSACAVNMIAGVPIGIDVLVFSTNAAIVQTYQPYEMKGFGFL